MKKGGYQILDLKNTSFTVGSSVEISGAYETIESTDKAILVSGLVVGGKQYDDVFAEVDTNNSNYVINVYDYTLTIIANDMVVVSLQNKIDKNVIVDYIPINQTKTYNIENNYLYEIWSTSVSDASIKFGNTNIIKWFNITFLKDESGELCQKTGESGTVSRESSFTSSIISFTLNPAQTSYVVRITKMEG